jgi:DNA-binding response OmpR family regulator
MSSLDPSRSLSVLVVDDELYLREELAVALEMEGFVVNSVGSYDDAHQALLSAWEPNGPRLDVVTVDLGLGGENGLQVIEDVASLWPKGNGPIVICLTGNYQVSTIKLAMGLGAVGYLTKPCSLKSITEKIFECLAERGLCDSVE